MIKIRQHSERYGVTDKEWKVSATGSIPPITGVLGINPPNLVPVLAVDGIVVLVTGSIDSTYLVSQKTLNDISESMNPHYSIISNGKIMWRTGSVVVGKTIPIINVYTDELITTGSQRDIVNRYADVKSVEYIYNGEKTNGVPNNLINQINYTLSSSVDRPSDTFDIWNLGLNGDYSITQLQIQTAQQSGSLDTNKLKTFLKGVNDRLSILRDDFNSIKDTFYNGVAPTSYGSYSVTQQAKGVDTDGDIKQNQQTQVNITTSNILNVQPTPTQQAIQQSTPQVTATSPDDLVTKWNSYGFTDSEKQALINDTPYTQVGIYDKIGTKTKISEVLNLAKDINALQITTGKQY